MTAPTTLPEALAEIDGLRGQVRDLLQLLGHEAMPSAVGGNASPGKTTAAYTFSEGLVPKLEQKESAQLLLDLHQMIETVPDVIFKLDLQGNLVGWNKRLELVTGFTPQELNDRPALAFVPEDEHAQTAAAIQQAFEEGYAELEGHMLTKEGRTIPYHWTGAALKNEEGRVIGITGVGRDVSDKRRTQAELQRQRQQLLSAQALAHVGSWEWEIASGDMEWSEEQFRIFGHEPGAIPTSYEVFLAAVLPDDHDRVRAGITETLKGQEPLDIECRIVRPNGEIRSIHCRSEMVPAHAGQRARMSGSTLDITDRKQSESALQQSEAHFRALIEHSSDIITVLDPDGTIRFESPSFERLLGYTQHEIDGRIVFDFIHPDDLPMVLEKFQKVVQRPGEPQTAEFRFRHKDGSWRNFEGIGRAAVDAKGQLCVIANSRDISERKRSEEVLIRSHGLLTSFVEHTPAAVAMLDRDLRYVAVSRRWYQDYRLNERDLIGKHHYDVFPEIRFMEEWQAIHRRCLGGSVERREEDRFIRADGSEDWLKWEVRPWQDETGGIGGIIMFTEVITERKRTEEALRMSDERYARATAIGHVGVWELDVAAGLYHGDINLKALFGYGPDEISTDPYVWLGLVHPEDQSIALKAWEGIVSGSTDDYYYELRMIRKDGTLIWTDVRGHAERDEHGSVRRLIGATVDITERKLAEEALQANEQAIRHLYETTAMSDASFEEQLQALLKLGCERLGLPIGLRTQVEGTQLRIVAAHQPDIRFTVGNMVPLQGSICARALEGGAPFFIPDFVRSAFTDHPLQKTFGINCYLGTNLVVGGQPAGTLCFMSDTPRHEPFADWEKDFVNLIARWVAGRLEQEHAETALRRSEARFRAIFDQTFQFIGLMHIDGTLIEANRTALEFAGLREQDVIGQFFWDTPWWTHSPVLQAQLREAVRKAASGTIVRFEATHPSPDGQLAYVDFSLKPARDERGEVTLLIAEGRDITDRKRAERALRESEELFSKAFRGSPNPIVISEAETSRCLEVNDAFLQLFGFFRQDVIGHPTLELGIWTKPERRTQLLGRLRAGEPVRNIELGFTTTRGELRHFLISSDLIELNGTLCLITVGSDITERKRAEELLRLTQFSIDRAADGVFWVAPDGRILSVNESACRMLEYSRDELTTMTVHDLDPQFHAEAWPAHWEELKRRGSMTFESKYWSSTGRVLDIEVTVNYLHFGGYEYNCAIMRDIGERKRVESELQRSHAFLRQVIDTTPNFIFAKDRDGRFTMVNQAMAAAYGTTVDELIGKTDADFNPNRDEVAFFRLKDLEVMDSLRDRFIPEEKITDAAGNVRWLQTVKRPILDGTGQAVMVLGAATDITERKRMEETLRRREHDLQQAVQERERISEDLHDGILQSIYAIGLGLEACKPLISDQPKKSAAKLKAEIQRTIGQLNHVLEEVRNFIAGLESHILDGQGFHVVLRTMVNSMAASYSIPARVAVEEAAAQHLSTEQAYHVMHVAREALSNSFRHSRASRIRLSLRQLRCSIRLSVTDNGVGFNPTAARDVGHGLANMAARARKIGGTLTLRSKLRQGATVLVDIPRRLADADD